MELLSNIALGFATAATVYNLTYCFVGVFLGTFIGVLPGVGPLAAVAMLLLSPALAEFALLFGPAEYFAVMVLGLVAASVVSTSGALRGVMMVCLGILLGTVGVDINSGETPFVVGMPELRDGVSLVVVAMGLFGISEVMVSARGATRSYVLRLFRFEPAPLLIGFVLGPMMEEFFRRAMLLSRGDPMVFVERPGCAALLGIALLLLLATAIPRRLPPWTRTA